MTKKVAAEIIDQLELLYPDAKAELDFNSAFELLIAVILSAQCTDVRVNQVTKVLFAEANTPETLSAMPLEKICLLYTSEAETVLPGFLVISK